MQVSVVLENAALHAEQMRQARLRQDLLLARENPAGLPAHRLRGRWQAGRLSVYARMQPAREVSGDLYDYFPLPDGRLAFFLGDVSGKGTPAALFMIAVRTLIRHLDPLGQQPGRPAHAPQQGPGGRQPDQPLRHPGSRRLRPRDGSVVLSLGGHPTPLLRRGDGQVAPWSSDQPFPGLFAAQPSLQRHLPDPGTERDADPVHRRLHRGLSLPTAPRQFGVGAPEPRSWAARAALPLTRCAEEPAPLQRFTAKSELQDDQTLFLLRRK